MARDYDDNELDMLDAIGERSKELRAYAKAKLDAGSTPHSMFTQLQDDCDMLRGWLIGRYGR